MDVPFYVALEPRWSRHFNDADGNPQLESVAATKLTQRRPDRQQRGGTVVIKLVVRVPASVFQPLQPQVIIEIPENMTQLVPVTVTAEYPDLPDEVDPEQE